MQTPNPPANTRPWPRRTADCTARLLPLLCLLCLALTATVQAQFNYEIHDGTITITEYTGPGGDGVIPETIEGKPVTSIGCGAFTYCASLTSVLIPNSVTSIEAEAFSGCTSLTSIVIPNSVTRIGDGAFSGCTGLTAINVDALNANYSSFDGVMFNKDRTVLILCPRGRNTIKIPPGVTSISSQALAGCWGLRAVYFDGDAPTMAFDVFGETMATLFYVSGTAGWETTMAGRPTVEWNGLSGAQSLELYAGLTVVGEIGKVYAIEYVAEPSEVDRSDWEGPQTDVTISRGFWMGKYEVTQGEYEAVMGSNPSWFNGLPTDGYFPDYGTDLTRPVESVWWDDATAYCVALTERERLAGRIAHNAVYRLPTEAEWEYACRAGTSTRFSYADDPGYTKLIGTCHPSPKRGKGPVVSSTENTLS